MREYYVENYNYPAILTIFLTNSYSFGCHFFVTVPKHAGRQAFREYIVVWYFFPTFTP